MPGSVQYFSSRQGMNRVFSGIYILKKPQVAHKILYHISAELVFFFFSQIGAMKTTLSASLRSK